MKSSWKKRFIIFVMLLCIWVYIPDGKMEEAKTEEDRLKERPSATRVVYICRNTYLYYAQNSPEWENLVIDPDPASRRVFGESACVVTALANCIVNAVSVWDLDRILDMTMYPVRIDSHSAVNARGVRARDKFEIRNLSDVVRYYPLIIGNYAGGNNRSGIRNRKNEDFYKRVLDAYQLEWERNTEWSEAVQALKDGKLVIACSGGRHSVISSEGHYFLLVAWADGYIYALDSYLRDRFPLDREQWIEILEPGLLRFHETDASRIPVQSRFIVTPSTDRTVYSKALLDDYIARSNRHE